LQIGIIADTHDRLEKIEKAVAFFNSNRLDLVIHAGDYIAPFTSRAFSDLQAEMVGVFGNNDGERKGLITAYKEIARIHEPPHTFKADKRSITVTHMDERLESLLAKNDIVIYAHSHRYEIKKEKNKLLINPGECCAYLTGMSSVVLLDTDAMEANVFDLQ